MTLGQNGILRDGHFCVFLEAKGVNFVSIDFILGLPLNINGNEGQTKFEVHILSNVAKMANFRPKISQDVTFAPNLNEHNSAIFYPILMFDHTKMINSARQIEC